MALEMKYFVLNPKAKKPNDVAAQASRMAMSVYAANITGVDPVLAADLYAWAERERQNALAIDSYSAGVRADIKSLNEQAKKKGDAVRSGILSEYMSANIFYDHMRKVFVIINPNDGKVLSERAPHPGEQIPLPVKRNEPEKKPAITCHYCGEADRPSVFEISVYSKGDATRVVTHICKTCMEQTEGETAEFDIEEEGRIEFKCVECESTFNDIKVAMEHMNEPHSKEEKK